jgi:hypothetical protein
MSSPDSSYFSNHFHLLLSIVVMNNWGVIALWTLLNIYWIYACQSTRLTTFTTGRMKIFIITHEPTLKKHITLGSTLLNTQSHRSHHIPMLPWSFGVIWLNSKKVLQLILLQSSSWALIFSLLFPLNLNLLLLFSHKESNQSKNHKINKSFINHSSLLLLWTAA